MNAVCAPLQSQVVRWLGQSGDTVRSGDLLVVPEAMKMEHEVRAGAAGQVRELLYAVGDTVDEGESAGDSAPMIDVW